MTARVSVPGGLKRHLRDPEFWAMAAVFAGFMVLMAAIAAALYVMTLLEHGVQP